MENINLFKFSSTFEAASNGGTLAYPNTSYIEDTGKLSMLLVCKKNYMYVEALEDGTTVSFTKKASSGSLYYSLDKQEWNELTEETPTVNNGEKVYFKGDLVPAANNGIGTFVINKQCNVAGNVMSLLFGDNFVDKTDLTGYNYAFYKLFDNCITIQSVKNLILPAIILASYCYGYIFKGCKNLTTAPELPATTLADSCYYNMFNGCSSLTTTPELSATTLISLCYAGMFNGCSSLTTAPELPATTLAYNCYGAMFASCSSLTTAPELPATTLEQGCYNGMFEGCTSLTSAPELPATTLKRECYWSMFEGCTSLTSAPELPATTLDRWCYTYMFKNCISLNYIKMLATNISASDCLTGWVSGVSSTGTFVKNSNAAWNKTGTSGIPEGWTVVDYAA